MTFYAGLQHHERQPWTIQGQSAGHTYCIPPHYNGTDGIEHGMRQLLHICCAAERLTCETAPGVRLHLKQLICIG